MFAQTFPEHPELWPRNAGRKCQSHSAPRLSLAQQMFTEHPLLPPGEGRGRGTRPPSPLLRGSWAELLAVSGVPPPPAPRFPAGLGSWPRQSPALPSRGLAPVSLRCSFFGGCRIFLIFPFAKWRRPQTLRPSRLLRDLRTSPGLRAL